MANLIPPMADEPPPEFLAFVSTRLPALRGEAARLTGGRPAPEVVMRVLSDLAGHWRRLSWLGRLTGRDAAGEYLDRRLTVRTRHWREDQIYPVEVHVLRDTAWAPPPDRVLAATGTARPLTAAATVAQYRRPPKPPEESVARQLAFLLPSTVRQGSEVIAEAEIAWVHAYRSYVWRRYLRAWVGVVLIVGYLIQFMSQFSAPA